MSRPRSHYSASNTGARLGYSLLSTLIPGTGQIAAGYRRRGTIMLAVTLLIVLGALYVYSQGFSTLLSWVVQPRVLIMIFVANVMILLFRVGVILDAFLTTRSADEPRLKGWQAGLAAIALSAMLIVTAAPHALVGYYTYLTHDTLTTVFSTESLSEAIPTPTPEAEVTATAEPTSTPNPEPDETSQQVKSPVIKVSQR